MSETIAIFNPPTGAPGGLREVGAYESEVSDESSWICREDMYETDTLSYLAVTVRKRLEPEILLVSGLIMGQHIRSL